MAVLLKDAWSELDVTCVGPALGEVHREMVPLNPPV
jgi:hypothetical protein